MTGVSLSKKLGKETGGEAAGVVAKVEAVFGVG